MNKYAHLAMRHWQKTDPDRYRQILESDREAFFSQLGEQAETEIQQLQDAIAGPDPAGESYLEKVGRLNMARLQAEERVLGELILIPEPEIPEDQEDWGENQAPGRHLELMRDLQKLREEE
jgi:hypothetical protein